jgi:hypothetical protein
LRLLSVAVVEMATMLGVVEAVGGEGKKEHRVLPSLLPSPGTPPASKVSCTDRKGRRRRRKCPGRGR